MFCNTEMHNVIITHCMFCKTELHNDNYNTFCNAGNTGNTGITEMHKNLCTSSSKSMYDASVNRDKLWTNKGKLIILGTDHLTSRGVLWFFSKKIF